MFIDSSASFSLLVQVDKVYYCAAIDKYITCARDGSFRLWQGGDLEYVKSVNNGSSWITDCMYLPYSRKMVFTTMDRAITYYDIARCGCAGSVACGPFWLAGEQSCMRVCKQQASTSSTLQSHAAAVSAMHAVMHRP